MLKYPLVGAVLITSAMVSLGHAQQPLSASLDKPTTRLSVQERCTGAPVDVMAASANERHLACDAANHALQLLARCNISPQRPLRIEISNEVRRPLGGVVFGLFDARQEKVLITQYENVASLVSGTPYGELAQREFYKSLIVHEFTHGVMHQNYKRRPVSHSAHEYPAYALQIESLPSASRERFLRGIDVRADGREFVFADSMLAFDPFFFAARAYEHFRASGDGCAHLLALLDGEAAFIWSRPPSR